MQAIISDDFFFHETQFTDGGEYVAPLLSVELMDAHHMVHWTWVVEEMAIAMVIE